MPAAPSVPDVLSPGKLGPITLRNRVLKAATYEGLSHRGRVTRDLVDFHVEYARGGVGMTTVAFCAVAKDGRTDKHQLLWGEDALPGMRALTDAVHAEGAAVSAQVGHGGPVANSQMNKLPVLAPSRKFHKVSMSWAQEITPAQIQRVTDEYAAAARCAIEAGFDAIEVHLGHNYLLSSFLSPALNKRKDQWGGSLENRARFPRDVLRVVRDTVGDRLAILAKVNMEDGYSGGFGLDEAIAFVQLLEADGTVDALEMTAGSSLRNPMYLFKGDAPIDDFAAVMPAPIRLGLKTVGRGLLKSYPYTDGYLLDDARKVRAAVGLPMVLLGGITDRAIMDTAMAEGFEYVAMARALLREPDLVNRIAADPSTPSLCIHCNRCMPTNYTGTRCPVIDEASPRSQTWGKPEGYAS